MQELFQVINQIFAFIEPLSNFLWDFPTNFAWYQSIPVLGNFSLAVMLLLGSGIYFSFRLGFVQVTHFKKGVKLLAQNKKTSMGISSTAAFFLSTAMRVGPGNIVGVTGAIAVGGPGALFWMWVSAFFGMSIAYAESVLAQIYKEKKGDEFVGGLPFYGKKLLGNKAWIGIGLSVLYILYAMCCLPAQGYNVVSSIGEIAGTITGNMIPVDSVFSYVVAAIVIVLTAILAFGGIKKVTKLTNMMVPVMAVVYIVTVIILIVLNLGELPYFFKAVFGGAFTPEAVFGGAFGMVLVQGVKRGLMSNEAGQGTITMSAAAAECEDPCEQGIISAIGVFLDTMIICTLSGFVVIMAHCWNGAEVTTWETLDKLGRFNLSVATLTPGVVLNGVMTVLVSFCFCLFAYTCLIGMITFSEIAANRISRSKKVTNTVRIIGIVTVTFGILSNLAGLELGNLWAFSDLGNILIVFANIPILFVGANVVVKATKHYKKEDETPFTSKTIDSDELYWDERR